MIAAAGVFGQPGLLVPFALVQLSVLLLLVRAVDLYERKPIGLVALMALLGATLAPATALVLRPLVAARLGETTPTRRALVAAVTEEPAKALCVLLLFGAASLLVGRLRELEFDGVNDGMVYGAAAGLGFAFTENLFYLIGSSDLQQGLSVFSSRTDFFGIRILSHAVYTAWFGAGLGAATWQRSRGRKVLLPLLGLALGIATHATHNVLALRTDDRAVRLADYLFLVAALAAMALWVSRERRAVVQVLDAERAAGLPIGPDDVGLAASYPTAVRRQLAAFRAGRGEEIVRLRRLRSALVRLSFSQWRAGRLQDSAAAAHRVEVRSLVTRPATAARVPEAALRAAAAARVRSG